ncbi:polysaccharide biosynthesis tyrosine autokinase [Gordonia sp. OPL2]|uniref:polysaccharide biosynthesis tyrosine autokinase n=1 Tax=Gordonia sp. OPL2 TaxID=2486274 RepID=UPI0021CCFBAB|nr:polysaccharide biosynthesis tyrosine autokinase [Gordonia sp. OPL2]ROZ85956.1 polysaccharide biosynthesis tyrosine autokinase [Gordonia sp. OPL2]
MNETSTVDARQGLPSWLRVLRDGWLVIAISTLVFALAGLVYCLLATPIYQASATMYISSTVNDSSTAAAYQGSLASEQRVASYTKLANSDVVLREAIGSGNLPVDVAVARTAVSASTTPNTVLLNVRARSSDRELAARLANGVGAALTRYVAQLETPAGSQEPLVKLSMVSPAAEPSIPVSPNTVRTVLLGVVIGAVVGLIVVFARNRLSDKVKGEADLEIVTDLPVVATVPTDSNIEGGKLVDFAAGASLAAESYRKLRTNLSFIDVDNPPHTVLVTSAVGSEGKTTTAMNLAASLAEAGNSVLLVDADLRRPQVASRMKLPVSIGLTNWLRGDAPLGDLLQVGPVDNLSVMTSGPQPPNPAELLDSERMIRGLTELAAEFDHVVLDSPPILPVVDAVILSKSVDAVLVVARVGRSKTKYVSSAIESLARAQARLAGIVLTDTKYARSATYAYYGSTSASQDSVRPAEPVHQGAELPSSSTSESFTDIAESSGAGNVRR